MSLIFIFAFLRNQILRNFIKKIPVYLSGIILLFLVLLTVSENIFKTGKKRCYDKAADLPDKKVALLLGTSKYLKGGKINLFYQHRINAAAELYKKGKIKFIIVSGDNSRRGYNEPKLMKNDLIKAGVPGEKIYPDYAGFRTFDSVVRSKKVFGQNSLLIISQRFHNLRALYIAKHFGIDAVAYNAEEVRTLKSIKVRFRERFARVKALFDLYLFNTKPRYLGKKIHIQ